MRDIEFRGWDIDNNRWVYGYYVRHEENTLGAFGNTQEDVDNNIKHFIFNDGWADWNMSKPWYKIDVAPESVGQFTGLYDKNNKKVYEGDICKAYKPNSYLDGAFIVIWDSKKGRWCYDGTSLVMKYQVGSGGNLACEVIGNDYENSKNTT